MSVKDEFNNCKNDIADTDISNENEFVKYYEQESTSKATIERSILIRDTIQRVRKDKEMPIENLQVVDIGSNAGSQSIIWAEKGHNVHGIEISKELHDISKNRATQQNLDIDFRLGDAIILPWEDDSMDICLMPELLEHVLDWQTCISEAVRVLKKEGLLYISTTNYLCPSQNEFELIFYSWYPGLIKRYCEKLSVTTKPEWVCHAKYPAIHWFSFYKLKKYLSTYDLETLDRFDIMDVSQRPSTIKLAITLMQKIPFMKLIGHILTPYTVVIAIKH